MYCKNFKTRKKNNKKEKRIYNYCTEKRKEITYEDCKECKFKEYIQKKPKQCVKIQNNNIKIHSNVKRSSKLTKLERNRTSLFTDDINHCIICRAKRDNLHEVFFGRNRQLSMKYGLVIPLCIECHQEMHKNKQWQDDYKRKGQTLFVKAYPDLDFLSIFHRNYL